MRMREEKIHCSWRPEAPLRVKLAGISYCDGSYRIRRKNSKISVFEYIISGQGTLKIGDQSHHPQAGDIYFITEGSDHEYWADPRDPWIKIWFNIAGPLPLALLDTYGLRGVHHVTDVQMEHIFRDAYEACCQDPSEAERHVALALHRIIMQAATELHSRREPTARQSQTLHDFLDRCVEETPTLNKMAEVMGRSESQTIRTFKREWGITPYQFLIERKLQKARVLLTGSAKGVKEIAGELGFNDEYHFSALFKQKVGLSPKNYRKAVEHGGTDG